MTGGRDGCVVPTPVPRPTALTGSGEGRTDPTAPMGRAPAQPGSALSVTGQGTTLSWSSIHFRCSSSGNGPLPAPSLLKKQNIGVLTQRLCEQGATQEQHILFARSFSSCCPFIPSGFLPPPIHSAASGCICNKVRYREDRTQRRLGKFLPPSLATALTVFATCFVARVLAVFPLGIVAVYGCFTSRPSLTEFPRCGRG